MIDLEQQTDGQLVALYGELTSMLRARSIVRSGNNPISDMAERVIADYYGVELAAANTKSYDVLTAKGERVQVKALRKTQASRRQLSALRTLDFDALVAVVFTNDMRLEEAIFMPIDAVRDHMKWSTTWKANSISLTKKLLTDPRVHRVSAEELVGAPARS
jgi:phosphoribosylaminoimidazole carboxylase (NCAIR synthetase)